MSALSVAHPCCLWSGFVPGQALSKWRWYGCQHGQPWSCQFGKPCGKTRPSQVVQQKLQALCSWLSSDFVLLPDIHHWHDGVPPSHLPEVRDTSGISWTTEWGTSSCKRKFRGVLLGMDARPAKLTPVPAISSSRSASRMFQRTADKMGGKRVSFFFL